MSTHPDTFPWVCRRHSQASWCDSNPCLQSLPVAPLPCVSEVLVIIPHLYVRSPAALLEKSRGESTWKGRGPETTGKEREAQPSQVLAEPSLQPTHQKNWIFHRIEPLHLHPALLCCESVKCVSSWHLSLIFQSFCHFEPSQRLRARHGFPNNWSTWFLASPYLIAEWPHEWPPARPAEEPSSWAQFRL